MSLHFQRQIEKLKRQILMLGALVEEAVAHAITAVEMNDLELAQQVIEGDTKIDEFEIDVEEECLHALALYQPVAFDLRFVVAVLKINNDLERIADLAVNVAEQTRFLGRQSGVDLSQFDIIQTGRRVRSMLKQSLDALVNMNPQDAQAVRVLDDEVDEAHRRTLERVRQAMREQPEKISPLLNVLSISRQLERMADHAVNIAEDVIYSARGDITRHREPEPSSEVPPRPADAASPDKPQWS